MRAAETLPFVLVVAVIIGLFILVWGATTLKKSERVTNEAQFTENLAYVTLKNTCRAWFESSVRNCCTGSDCCACSECQGEFVDSFKKFFQIPWWAHASGLEYSPLFQGPELSPATENCVSNGLAITGMDNPNTTGTAGALGIIRNALKDSNVINEYRRNISMSCARLCEWVVGRDQACEQGPVVCAEQGRSAYGSLP